MLEFRKGTTTFSLLTVGYYFRLQGLDVEPAVDYEKRPYSHGAIQIGDRSLDKRELTLEGFIAGSNSTDEADALWSALTRFFKPLIFPTSTDEITLFISENLYFKIDSIQRISSAFRRGTSRRASNITIKAICADPFIYEYEPAYIMRCGESELWLEGKESIDHNTGAVATHRSDGISSDYSVAVEAAADNLLTENQASVETDTTGFNAVLAATLTQSTTYAWHLDASLKTVTPNAAPNEGFYTTGVSGSNGETYTASVYIKGAAAGAVLEVYLYDADNADTGTKSEYTLTTDWGRCTCQLTLSGDTADLRLYVETKIQGAVTFYCDGLQIEERAWATSFTSTSRASGELFYDCMDGCDTAEETTISFWFQPNVDWDDAVTKAGEEEYPLSQGDAAATGGFYLQVDRANTLISLVVRGASGKTLTYNYTGVLTGNTAIQIGFHISATAAQLYINGALQDSDTGTFGFIADELEIGYTSENAAYLPEGLIKDLIVYDDDKASSIATWYSSFDATFPRRGWCVSYYEARNASATADSFTFNNPCYWEAHPIITLRAQGTCSDVIMVNTTDDSLQFAYTDTGLTIGLEAVLDCRYATALRGSTNTIAYFDGAFLQLMAGDNALTYKGADCDISFEFQTMRD